MEMKAYQKIRRLREKYDGNEMAHDLLVYHMVSEGGRDRNIDAKIKTAMSFLSSDKGQGWYQQVVDASSRESDPIPGHEGDYTHEWAQAAQHKDGLMALKPGMISSQHFTLQALSRFSKRL